MPQAAADDSFAHVALQVMLPFAPPRLGVSARSSQAALLQIELQASDAVATGPVTASCVVHHSLRRLHSLPMANPKT